MMGHRNRYVVVNLDQHCAQRDGQIHVGVAFGGDRRVNRPRILLRVGGAEFDGD